MPQTHVLRVRARTRGTRDNDALGLQLQAASRYSSWTIAGILSLVYIFQTYQNYPKKHVNGNQVNPNLPRAPLTKAAGITQILRRLSALKTTCSRRSSNSSCGRRNLANNGRAAARTGRATCGNGIPLQSAAFFMSYNGCMSISLSIRLRIHPSGIYMWDFITLIYTLIQMH